MIHRRTHPVPVEGCPPRIAEKIVLGDACWEWVGARSDTGYGNVWWGELGRCIQAHRVLFYLANGYWPEHVDHLCQNRACVNPQHLEDVTNEENQRRAAERRTHCRRGHEWAPENIYWAPDGRTRMCRTCKRIRKRVGYVARTRASRT